MSTIPPVPAIDATTPASSTGNTSADQELEDAFQQGVLNFMVSMMGSLESDVASATQDNTSDPDAPD